MKAPFTKAEIAANQDTYMRRVCSSSLVFADVAWNLLVQGELLNATTLTTIICDTWNLTIKWRAVELLEAMAVVAPFSAKDREVIRRAAIRLYDRKHLPDAERLAGIAQLAFHKAKKATNVAT